MPTVGSSGINPRGVYAAGTKYLPGDIVSYNSNAYMAAVTTTGNLPTSTAYWTLLSSAGTAGATGTAGTGAQGGAMPALVSGTYYSPQCRVNPTFTNLSLTRSNAFYLPFSISYSCTINWIGVCVYSVPSGTLYVRTAIYNSDANGQPSSLFMSDVATGNFPVGTGTSMIGSGTTTTVPPGNYWAAIAVGNSNTATGSFVGWTGADAIRYRGYATATEAQSPMNMSYLSISDASSYSTGLPATAPALSSMTGLGAIMPAFFWKIA